MRISDMRERWGDVEKLTGKMVTHLETVLMYL
jgi:hypothetical protein